MSDLRLVVQGVESLQKLGADELHQLQVLDDHALALVPHLAQLVLVGHVLLQELEEVVIFAKLHN